MVSVRRLAQGLDCSFLLFSETFWEYSNHVLKTDSFNLYLDIIGVAVQTTDEMIQNIDLVFQCTNKVGFKLSRISRWYGRGKVSFLVKQSVAKESDRLKIKLTTSQKLQTSHVGEVGTVVHRFRKLYRHYLPKPTEKLIQLDGLLQKDAKFLRTDSVWDSIFENNEYLAKAAKITLRRPLSEKHSLNMSDANEHAAGKVLLTENHKDTKWVNSHVLCAYGTWITSICHWSKALNHVYRGIFSHVFCLQRICPQTVSLQKSLPIIVL